MTLEQFRYKMSENNLKIYINQTHSGDLLYEDTQFVFNYLLGDKELQI